MDYWESVYYFIIELPDNGVAKAMYYRAYRQPIHYAYYIGSISKRVNNVIHWASVVNSARHIT